MIHLLKLMIKEIQYQLTRDLKAEGPILEVVLMFSIQVFHLLHKQLQVQVEQVVLVEA